MIKTPVNQVRLTNVAIVRHKAKGQRFEVACYKNKVQNYRDNVENDLNEVLQIYEIFTNVSKGELAKKAEIKKCLHEDKDEAIKIILEKGELQVSELERESEFESLKLKIANIASTMCVNKETSVPFPVPIILKAMDDLKFSVKEGHNAKKQALQLIKDLPKVLPCERAKMKVRFTCTNLEKSEEIKKMMSEKYDESKAEGKLSTLEIEQKVENGQYELTYLILPRLIRDLTDLCNKDDEVSIEIVEHYVYSRLVSAQEEEEAKQFYEKSVKEREDAAEQEALKDGLVIVSSNFEESKKGKKETKQASSSGTDGDIKCSTCNDTLFSSKEEFKTHYKSEWHIENTKRKMEGKPRMAEDEFMLWKEEEIGKETIEIIIL